MYTFGSVKSELPYYQEVLLFYKIEPCPSTRQTSIRELRSKTQICNQPSCFHYHNPDERRRPVFNATIPTMLYQPIICESLAKGLMCFQGDLCKFAHTQNEINYHPLFYKTEPCMGCPYDKNIKFCPYYHTDEASRKITLLEKSKAKLDKNMPNPSEINHGRNFLDYFKSRPCPLKGNHNPKVCEFYHHDKDRRRPNNIFSYSPNMCPVSQKGEPCFKGDACRFAHNKVEQLYHSDKYKKKFCLLHPHNIPKCDYGSFCSFAHSENEIQIELLHNLKKDEYFYLYKYKTVFCPYIYEHDRNQCVYAHNPQDFRRDPHIFHYNPLQCPNWTQKQIFGYEEGECPNQMQCEFCHGWKELEYHPLVYKTKICKNKKKCTKKDCPFYHNEDQRRNLKPNFEGPEILPSLHSHSSSVPGPRNDYNTQFAVQPEIKTMKKKVNHYSEPITAIYDTFFQKNIPFEDFELKQKQEEPSNRHTSNVSAVNFFNNDMVEASKKTKTKKMSLQNNTNKLISSISTKPNEARGQITYNNVHPAHNKLSKSTQQEDDQKTLGSYFVHSEPEKLIDNEIQLNETFDSLHSYSDEDLTSKPNDILNDHFLENLFSNLEKKGLQYVVQYFKDPNVDVEVIKSFDKESLDRFPEIHTEDFDKIVQIIQDTLEGEAIFCEINTLNEEHANISSKQAGVINCNYIKLDLKGN